VLVSRDFAVKLGVSEVVAIWVFLLFLLHESLNVSDIGSDCAHRRISIVPNFDGFLICCIRVTLRLLFVEPPSNFIRAVFILGEKGGWRLFARSISCQYPLGSGNRQVVPSIFLVQSPSVRPTGTTEDGTAPTEATLPIAVIGAVGGLATAVLSVGVIKSTIFAIPTGAVLPEFADSHFGAAARRIRPVQALTQEEVVLM